MTRAESEASPLQTPQSSTSSSGTSSAETHQSPPLSEKLQSPPSSPTFSGTPPSPLTSTDSQPRTSSSSERTVRNPSQDLTVTDQNTIEPQQLLVQPTTPNGDATKHPQPPAGLHGASTSFPRTQPAVAPFLPPAPPPYDPQAAQGGAVSAQQPVQPTTPNGDATTKHPQPPAGPHSTSASTPRTQPNPAPPSAAVEGAGPTSSSTLGRKLARAFRKSIPIVVFVVGTAVASLTGLPIPTEFIVTVVGLVIVCLCPCTADPPAVGAAAGTASQYGTRPTVQGPLAQTPQRGL